MQKDILIQVIANMSVGHEMHVQLASRVGSKYTMGLKRYPGRDVQTPKGDVFETGRRESKIGVQSPLPPNSEKYE